MTTQKHTPTPAHALPWVATDDGYITSGNDYIAIFGAEEWAHDEPTGVAPPWMLQDIAFIVLAVNNHERMLEALRAALQSMYDCPSNEHRATEKQLEAAIAAAEGRIA